MGWHLAPYATAISITVIILAFYFSTLISHFHKMGNLQQGEVKAAGKGGGGGGADNADGPGLQKPSSDSGHCP